MLAPRHLVSYGPFLALALSNYALWLAALARGASGSAPA
jgi:hypothetical protein